MNTDEFSLRALTAAVLAELDTEDREQIIKEVERRIPAKLTGEALRQALPAFVHQAAPRWTIPVQQRLREGEGKSRASGRSPKVAAIREAWAKHLEGRYTVEDGSLRRLGDFGYADLMFVAQGLEEKAQRNHQRAAAMHALADALAKHKVRRVRDLPDAVLAGHFTQATAA
jgi:hypothetical protein